MAVEAWLRSVITDHITLMERALMAGASPLPGRTSPRLHEPGIETLARPAVSALPPASAPYIRAWREGHRPAGEERP